MNCSNCFPASSKSSMLVIRCSRAVRSLDCAAWIARVPPIRAPSGRGRPAMRSGGLAWLAHRGGCPQGCTHTQRVRRQVEKSSSVNVRWQEMRGGVLLCSTRSVGDQRRAEAQRAASHKSGSGRALLRTRASCTGNRASLAHNLSRMGPVRRAQIRSNLFVA